nr:MAG: hypothetical protein EDM05_32600 [Leptolyngbya sp. IPPAS B-1204]
MLRPDLMDRTDLDAECKEVDRALVAVNGNQADRDRANGSYPLKPKEKLGQGKPSEYTPTEA